MFTITGEAAFWIFASLFFGSLALSVVAAKMLSSERPNPIKSSTYECGQPPVGRAQDYMLTGTTRYLAYAIIFFALEAFTWIILTSSTIFTTSSIIILFVSLYLLIISIGIFYFIVSLKRLIR